MNDVSHYSEAYYEREIAENGFKPYNLLRPDQLAAFCYAVGLPFYGDEKLEPRKPKDIYSIGAGEGVLEAELELRGFKVTGIDPAKGAKKLYKGKELIPSYSGGGDTIMFCESIEHLERAEIDRILHAVPQGARVIIVNWLSHHPLRPTKDGWDHITLVDDGLYDEISRGWHVLVRRNSHLVMEKL